TAGASCWGIKQRFPASADGIFWIRTTTLVAPEKFTCDMTTDGGGWVLVGRGREAWDWSPASQGNQYRLQNDPNGQATKNPVHLSADKVNGLLDGAAASTLQDGIRLRRAANTGGTSWQEVRWYLSNPEPWSWHFSEGKPLASMSVNGTVYPTAGTTRDTKGNDSVTNLPQAGTGVDGTNRVVTHSDWPETSRGNRAGFAMGNVSGSTSGFWYAPNGTDPIPFTQVWLRPRILDSVTGPLPSGGSAARQVPWVPSDSSENLAWGVGGPADWTGRISTADPSKAYVLAMQEAGGRMFVGGSFTKVTNNSGGSINHKFLTAFDVNTGDWISSCTPTLDGRVWDMATSSDGKLIIAGDFTQVNGDTVASGLAKLNPSNCQVDTSFRVRITKNGGRGMVRGIDLLGDRLFIGGQFNSVEMNGGPVKPAPNTYEVNALTGQVGGWRPQVNGTVFDVDASELGDRVYLAGWFTTINGVGGEPYATRISDGAPLSGFSWIRTWQGSSGTYSQTVKEIGDQVFIGGREHFFAAYDRNTGARTRTNLTVRGGDYQAAEEAFGYAFGTCHCGGSDGVNISDKTAYTGNDRNLNNGATRSDRIQQVGLYDGNGKYLDWWLPSISTETGDGPWAMTRDSNECIWQGGDTKRDSYSGNAAQDWAGGFTKYCSAVDRSVPSAPNGHNTRIRWDDSVEVTWGAASDPSNDLRYLVFRDGNVVGYSWGGNFVDTNIPSGTHQYAVAAIDQEGNIGPSTTPSNLEIVAPPQEVELMPATATWDFTMDAAQAPAGWQTPGFSPNGWGQGPAEMGFGDGDEGTVVHTGNSSPFPITGYFRTTLNLPNPGQYGSIRLELVRDDGAAVSINGTEVVRDNLPAGALTPTTEASSVLWGSDERDPVSFTLPTQAFQPGNNTIAVEVHNANQWSGDMSMSLRVVGVE
ncbi:MAG: delta-60 repeat domain-containing protein, partial [Microthrixaceae bacterium]|nr:delta-60 repeat domain-containing protein [Microthrixaceae bacterium]